MLHRAMRLLWVVLALGCANRFGEREQRVVPEEDARVIDDLGPPLRDSKPIIDDFGVPPEPEKIGGACSSDDDCDRTGAGFALCSRGAFGGDSLFPTSVCIGRECVTEPCALGGVCLATSTTAGICMPACQFTESEASPTGCIGNNRCHYQTSVGTTGAGYCLGGCRVDADCPSGLSGRRRCVPERIRLRPRAPGPVRGVAVGPRRRLPQALHRRRRLSDSEQQVQRERWAPGEDLPRALASAATRRSASTTRAAE